MITSLVRGNQNHQDKNIKALYQDPISGWDSLRLLQHPLALSSRFLSHPPKHYLLLPICILLLVRSTHQLLFVHLIKHVYPHALEMYLQLLFTTLPSSPISFFLLGCPDNWEPLSDLNCQTPPGTSLNPTPTPPCQKSILFPSFPS